MTTRWGGWFVLVALALPNLAWAQGADDLAPAAGSYANAVVAGETASGAEVVLAAGWHTNFPIQGARWDNVVLKLGSKGYRYTSTAPASSVSLQVHQNTMTLATAAWMEAFDLADTGPVAQGKHYVAISFKTEARASLPQAALDLVQKVNERVPALLLSVYRVSGGTASITINSVTHTIKPDSLSGHVEVAKNAALNLKGARRLFFLYDYAGGVRPYDRSASPVWTNGRMFVAPAAGAALGVPVSPPISVSGSLQPILSKKTILTSKVEMGPFILERRLTSFRTPTEDVEAYKGLKEVWTWRGWPLGNGTNRHAVHTSPGVKTHGETEAVLLNGKIVTIGGIAIQGIASHVTTYDPLTKEWGRLPALPAPRHHTGAVAHDGRIYVMGGARDFWPELDGEWKPEATLYVYTPGASAWERGPDMPEPRFGHDVVQHQGRFYIVGGTGKNHQRSPVLIFDPASGAWKKGAEIPTPRHHVSAFVHAGKIYVLGGREGPLKQFRTVEVYDPAADVWTKAPDTPFYSNGGNVLVVGGKIYHVGGESIQYAIGGEVNGGIWRMDPATKSWSEVGRMLIPRHAMGAVATGGKIYMLFGTTGANGLSPWTPSSAVEWFKP